MGQQGNDLISIAELPGLGRYVAVRRHDLHLRCDELADRLGAEEDWIYALEDGALPGLTPGVLVRLAIALEVDQAILLRLARLPAHDQGTDHAVPNLTYLIERTAWRISEPEEEREEG